MSPRAATFGVFVVNGAMMGTWLAHIAWLQERLGVSKATLGFLLLFTAVGVLIAMPLTGQLLDRRSSASVTRIATLAYCLVLPLPLLAPSPAALALALLLFGMTGGAMDVSMNAHGVAVERDQGRPIMSSLHGGWSVGGFLAAGLSVVAAAAGVDPRVEALIVGAALWLTSLYLTAHLGRASVSRSGSAFALPSRGVVLLGVMALLAMVTEGAISDWSGIYLRQDLGASAAAAATGYAGFALGMAIGRLSGDALNRRFGAPALLRGGMLLVAAALASALLIESAVPAVIGFVIVGVGIANAVPLLFSAAGRHEPAGPSLAAVFTVGYTGFLAGPPLIGFLADAVGLPLTLGLAVVMALTVAALGVERSPRAIPVPSR